MAREKKDGYRINYLIEKGVYDRLKEYATDRGQTMTMAIERLLSKALDDEGISLPEKDKNPEAE
jgi:predicted DNA-binding ribbon-helix-helix protein